MAEDNNSPSNAEGGGFTGGTATPGGQESMGGTLGTLNSNPSVENSGTSVSVMGAVAPLGGGLGNASASNLAFNPSAIGVQPGTFGPNTGAVNPSQFSLGDPNKQQSTGLSPASIGVTPTMGLLGNTPFSQQTGALHPGSVDSGMAFNPGALNNGMAGLPGHIPGATGIPDSTKFSPIAPSVPQPSQTNNLLSWSQEPASTKNAQAASYMPSGLGYASLSSPSAPSSPANPFQNTSLSPLNSGYSVLATPHERDMAIRTIAAEADPSTQGYAAVAAVIANRAALNGQPDPLTGMAYPGSVGGVISQPSQFSGYNDHNYHGIDPTSDRYQHIGSVFDNVLSGQLSDPTGGATYYYAPSGMPNGLAPSWAKNLPAGQTIGTQVFFGGTPSQPASQAASITPDQTGNRLSWSEVPSNAPSVQPTNSLPNPYGSLFRAPPAPLVSLNSMPAGLGYSAYTGTQTPGNAITIGPGGPQSTQSSLGTIASPWGTGTSDEAMNFAMARGPAGLAANMITPSTVNPATARADIPQGDYDSSALQYAPTRTAPSLVPLSSENGQRPNPALATYDNGMLFNPNYGENNSGVVGQWGVPGSAESQPSSVYSPESPLLNRPYVAAYSPGLLSALPPESTPQVAASATAAPTIPTGVVSPAPATIASPSERPPLTVNAPHSPDIKNAAAGYDLHPVDYNPFPNSQPTKLQGSDFLNSPTGSFGRGFNYLAGHGGTYSSPGGGMGTPSPTTQQTPPAASTDTTAPAPPPFQSWYKDASGNWYFGQAPEGYISPFPFVTPSTPTIPEGFAGGGGVSFVNNDPMADPEQSAKDNAYVPDEPSAAPSPGSYSLHPVEYDPFTTQQDSNVALNNAVAYSGSLRSQERRQQADAGWQDAYQTFAKPAVDFVTAPKRIMSGELTPSDPEFTDSAIQGAAMLTGRGLASPGEGYGIFGGTGSAAAPPFVNTAKMRLWAGADPAKVWKDTGWMKEVTGNKMMHEISDKNSAMKPISGDMIDKPLSIADIFHHPELEKHYPGILDTPAQVRSDLPSNVYGGFNPNDGSIVLNADRSPSDMRDTILHELNHAVQMKEGFSHGYNPDAPAVKQFVTEYNASNYPPISNYDVYHRMEGEDKSFATMNRKDMTDAERRSSPPWKSSNLPSGTPLYDAGKMQRWYYGKEDTPTPVAPQLSAGPLHDEVVRDLSGKTAGGEDPTRGLANAKTSDVGPVEKNALRRTRNMIQDLGGNKPSPGLSEAEAAAKLRNQQGPLPAATGMPAHPPITKPFWDRPVPPDAPKPIQMSMAPPEADKRIIGYHGSPADFDKFDDAYIGTGEGAAMRGRGHYIAEAEAVGKGYRDRLSPGKGGTPEDLAASTLYQFDGDRNKAISELQSRIDSLVGVPEQYKAKNSPLPAALDLLKSDTHVGGRMYKVGIKADPGHFLDWEKSLNEQSSAVRAKIAPLVQQELKRRQAQRGGGPLPDPENDLSHEGYLQTGNLSGGEFYQGLGDKKSASDTLKAAGIPGIRYLDQHSRGAGEGTYNRVVFDPKTIDILKKYGVAGVGLGAAGIAATQQNSKPPGYAKGGAVKKRNKDEFDWNIPLSKQSEHVQRLVRARLET